MRARRPSPAFAGSLAVHLVLGAVLARVLMDPGSLDWAFPRDRVDATPVERIAYVAVTPAPPPQIGRAGGDGRPVRGPAQRSAALPVAPTRTPAVLAPARPPTPRDADDAGGTGPLVGGGGPLRGVQPRYGDPRVWAPPGEVAAEPKSEKERLDSAFAVRFKMHQDSMAVLARVRRPGDWTVAGKDGTKYGVEPGNGGPPKLWLGRIAIPLPLGIGPQPGQLERERALRTITSDLAQQSTRRLTEDEFRKAVRQIRERKEWERSRQPAAVDKGATPESSPSKADPRGGRD